MQPYIPLTMALLHKSNPPPPGWHNPVSECFPVHYSQLLHSTILRRQQQVQPCIPLAIPLMHESKSLSVCHEPLSEGLPVLPVLSQLLHSTILRRQQQVQPCIPLAIPLMHESKSLSVCHEPLSEGLPVLPVLSQLLHSTILRRQQQVQPSIPLTMALMIFSLCKQRAEQRLAFSLMYESIGCH